MRRWQITLTLLTLVMVAGCAPRPLPVVFIVPLIPVIVTGAAIYWLYEKLKTAVFRQKNESQPADVTSQPTRGHSGPPSLAEPVLLGVSAPASVRPGQEFTARFIAYIEELEEEVDERLADLSPRATTHLGLRRCRWEKGTKIMVRVHGAYLNVTHSEQIFTWEGNYQQLDFDVHVVGDAPETVTVLKFDVLIGEFNIAPLRLDLSITSQAVERRIVSVESEPAQTAFASYASQDRSRVLDRISEIQRIGIDVFLDCLSLHPGEEWKPRLEQEIRERELFLLFWSVHAKESEWVTWEWRTALQHKGLAGVEPHPLDPVTDAAPPEELSSLHFGDPNMLIRAATGAKPGS